MLTRENKSKDKSKWQKHIKANQVVLHFENYEKFLGQPVLKLLLVCGKSTEAMLHLPSPLAFPCLLFRSRLLHYWRFLTKVFQPFIPYHFCHVVMDLNWYWVCLQMTPILSWWASTTCSWNRSTFQDNAREYQHGTRKSTRAYTRWGMVVVVVM